MYQPYAQIGALSTIYQPGQQLRLHRGALSIPVNVNVGGNPILVFRVARDRGDSIIADLVATSDGDTTSPFSGGRFIFTKSAVDAGLAKKVGSADYYALGSYYRSQGNIPRAQRYEAVAHAAHARESGQTREGQPSAQDPYRGQVSPGGGVLYPDELLRRYVDLENQIKAADRQIAVLQGRPHLLPQLKAQVTLKAALQNQLQALWDSRRRDRATVGARGGTPAGFGGPGGAIVASLQQRLNAARAAGNTAEVNGLVSILRRYGIRDHLSIPTEIPTETIQPGRDIEIQVTNVSNARPGESYTSEMVINPQILLEIQNLQRRIEVLDAQIQSEGGRNPKSIQLRAQIAAQLNQIQSQLYLNMGGIARVVY